MALILPDHCERGHLPHVNDTWEVGEQCLVEYIIPDKWKPDLRLFTKEVSMHKHCGAKVRMELH